MHETHIYITVDSAYPKTSEKTYGYLLECTGMEKTIHDFGRVEGTYHHAVLAAIIEAIKRFHVSCEIHIHTGNSYILSMIDNNLHKWAATEFLTAKGKPISNQEEWIELWNIYNKHLVFTEPGTHSYENWLQMEIEVWKRSLKNVDNYVENTENFLDKQESTHTSDTVEMVKNVEKTECERVTAHEH